MFIVPALSNMEA